MRVIPCQPIARASSTGQLPRSRDSPLPSAIAVPRGGWWIPLRRPRSLSFTELMDFKPLRAVGEARTRPWQIARAAAPCGEFRASFRVAGRSRWPLSFFSYAFSTTYRRLRRSCNRSDSNCSSDFVRGRSQPSLIPVVCVALVFLCSSPSILYRFYLCRNRAITLESRLSRARRKNCLIRSGRNCPPFGWHEFLDERTNLRDGKLSSVNHLRRRLSNPNRYLSGIDFILEQVDANNDAIALRNGIQL